MTQFPCSCGNPSNITLLGSESFICLCSECLEIYEKEGFDTLLEKRSIVEYSLNDWLLYQIKTPAQSEETESPTSTIPPPLC